MERFPVGAQPLDLSEPCNAVQWRSRWLSDPAFRLSGYRRVFSAERIQANRSVLQNIHTLFRKSFRIGASAIRSAKLFITADDMYKLSINGRFIGSGPAQSQLFAYNYNGWDVGRFLTPGMENVIAADVYYQGMHNYSFISADNMQGLLCQLEIVFDDETACVVSTDTSWRYKQSAARTARYVFGYETQFSEDVDMRLWEDGWDRPAFDDGGWQRAFIPAVPHPPEYSLIPQPTPPVAHYLVYPQHVEKIDAGRYLLDFGTELTGTAAFIARGPSGHVIEVRHGEELSGDGSVRYDMRANCRYQEYVTLSGLPGEIVEFYEYKGFRYMEVLNWPGELAEKDIWVVNRHYPFSEDACRFHSSDETLNRIWEICRNGVRQGTHDVYMDCPTREKGGFLGDAYITGLSHLILTGDAKILRKYLADCARSARLYPGITDVSPTSVVSMIAEYSMLWPMLLHEYYMWSADVDFVVEMLPVLDGMLEHFEGYENASGLLEGLHDVTHDDWPGILIDWPANMRDDYDFERASKGVCAVANLFYFGALTAAEALYRAAGSPGSAERILNRSSRLVGQIVGTLYDPASGLLFDAVGSTHHSLHANALPLAFGLELPGGNGPLVAFIRGKRLACGVYIAYFVLKGLCRAGRHDLAYELITSADEHSWQTMLKSGATTCMEVWEPGQKPNTSWCHPWSSAPIPILASEIIGVRSGEPGWKTVCFTPNPPEGLNAAELSFRIPQGTVHAGFRRSGGIVECFFEVPDGCKPALSLPAASAKIARTGTGAYIGTWKTSRQCTVPRMDTGGMTNEYD